jgi:hypothetical protein
LELVDVFQHFAGSSNLGKAPSKGCLLGQRHILALAAAGWLRLEPYLIPPGSNARFTVFNETPSPPLSPAGKTGMNIGGKQRADKIAEELYTIHIRNG